MKMAARQKYLPRHWAKRKGASTVEYAVVLGLISLVSLGALTALGVKSKAVFEQVVSALEPGPEAQPASISAPAPQTVSP